MRVQARRLIDDLRRELSLPDSGDTPAGTPAETGAIPPPAALAERLLANLEAAEGRLRLRRVINATGIFLHTNLGRAPLPAALVEELGAILGGYCDLEIDLESGRRRDRNSRLRALLGEMLGAADAVLVNNNAAALTLALFALARGREVLVSRGELVEIGGSFRIPEILEAAGARLREVGSTNRTRLEDYERALGEGSALLLKVFPSNYRIEGFTAEVAAEELAALGKKHGIPLLVDEGSGLLLPGKRPGIDHPSLKELLEQGCDLVCASGDKLLGGPQAGILAGREDLVAACRRSPLYRALRPDRYTFAATEAILRHHRAGLELPIERLWPGPAAHQQRIARLQERLGAGAATVAGYIGGGCAPGEAVPALALTLPPSEALLRELRLGGADAEGPLPPVVGYLREERLVLDLRTVDPADEPLLVRAVERARARLQAGFSPEPSA